MMMMRTRPNICPLLAGALVLGVTACVTPKADVAAFDKEAVRDSVQILMDAIPGGLAADGPNGWLNFFEDTPAFFMASDGQTAFVNHDSAEVFVEAFAKTVASMKLSWESVRIEPIAPGLATVAASYQESITDVDGKTISFGGYMTGVARSQSGRYRLQHLHWSSPVQ